MSVNNNRDFLRWEIKPIWKVVFKSIMNGSEAAAYEFEILGLNRSNSEITRNWEKIHSVEQFNQGRTVKPSDFIFTIAVKENGKAYEALRRLAIGGVEFDVQCDLIQDVASHSNSPVNNPANVHVWMKGFEKFYGCVITRESVPIEIATMPVREFQCDALRHGIMQYNADSDSFSEIIEGDGVYNSATAYADAAKFANSLQPEE
jgi:hypothetical protein